MSAAMGSDSLLDCLPVKGAYLDPVSAVSTACPAGSYCEGLSRDVQPLTCGAHMTSDPGASSWQDCFPLPGYIWDDDAQQVQACPAASFCTGTHS
jgi:hypothetical protein